MPRFGKKFKMFEKIVPSLELDITDLLSEGSKICSLWLMQLRGEYDRVCVFQGLSSVCCVETWPGRSAPTVLKIPFSARRDSNSSARRVQLRCVFASAAVFSA